LEPFRSNHRHIGRQRNRPQTFPLSATCFGVFDGQTRIDAKSLMTVAAIVPGIVGQSDASPIASLYS